MIDKKPLKGEEFILAYSLRRQTVHLGRETRSHNVCRQEAGLSYETSGPTPQWPTSFCETPPPKGSINFPGLPPRDQCSTWEPVGDIHIQTTVDGLKR